MARAPASPGRAGAASRVSILGDPLSTPPPLRDRRGRDLALSLEQLVVEARETGDVLIDRVDPRDPGSEALPQAGLRDRALDHRGEAFRVAHGEMQPVLFVCDLLCHPPDAAADDRPAMHE